MKKITNVLSLTVLYIIFSRHTALDAVSRVSRENGNPVHLYSSLLSQGRRLDSRLRWNDDKRKILKLLVDNNAANYEKKLCIDNRFWRNLCSRQ